MNFVTIRDNYRPSIDKIVHELPLIPLLYVRNKQMVD